METKKEHPILIPYDFTSVSDVAITHAAEFSKLCGQPLIVLNIIDESTRKFFRYHSQINQLLNTQLDNICKRAAKKYKVPVSYLVREGEILSINNVAKELSISYMFIGIDQPHTLVSKVLRMIGSSPVPVYVVQGNIEWKNIKTIAFPVDSYEETRQKTACAVKLAKLNKATVKLFSVYIKEKEQNTIQRVRVKQIEKMLFENEVPYTTEYAQGEEEDFADELLEYGQANKTDMYVLMKTPRTYFSNYFFSAVDKKVLLNTHNVPSVYVNPRDAGIYK